MRDDRPAQHTDAVDIPPGRPFAGYLLAGIIVLALVGGATALFSWAGRDEPTTVPDLAGLTVTQAIKRCEAAGLGLVASQNPDSAELVVEEQDPPAGTNAVTGDVVRVYLDVPSRETEVPDVVGLSVDTATKVLADAELSISSVTAADAPEAQPGVIFRQDPAAGTFVSAGEPVALWVAESRIVVPDLSGLSLEDADRRLQELGLHLRAVEAGDGAEGAVTDQIPEPGTRLDNGDDVTAVFGDANPNAAPEQRGPSPLYRALAESYDFTVLYPPALPPDMRLGSGSENPRHVASGGGGFEIAYEHADNPEAGLTLMEGNWFEEPFGEGTTVDVRGHAAFLRHEDEELILSWQEGPTRYAIRAAGLEDGLVIEFGRTLEAIDDL